MTFQNILLRPSGGMTLDNLQSIRTAVKHIIVVKVS
jgi:hypothetical protein